jgi:dienelactone hydrolase
MLAPDNLQDFSRRNVTLLGEEKQVLVRGKGPAVIVMHEIYGFTPEVARFCRWISDSNLTVFAPILFGTPGQRPSKLGSVAGIIKLCVSHEFKLFAANQSSPVVNWLRALVPVAFKECGGRGVGVIGLCLTGNFALAMAVDPTVVAPVMGEPSLPVFNSSGMHISPADLATIQQRVKNDNLEIPGYRFKSDNICKQERFDRLHQELGPGFRAHVLPDEFGNPEGKKPPHSVFTIDLIDRKGEPTRDAVDEVIAFFQSKLA